MKKNLAIIPIRSVVKDLKIKILKIIIKNHSSLIL